MLGSRPKAAAPALEGFVVVSTPPLPRTAIQDLFHLFPVDAAGRLLAPTVLDWSPPTLANGLLAHREAVWAYGTARDGVSAALSVCVEGRPCRSKELGRCPSGRLTSQVLDLRATREGLGVALAEQALWIGPLEPDDDRAWTCHDQALEARRLDGMGSARVARLRDLLVRPEGLYLCADLEVEPCAAARAAVLTASIASASSWSILFEGPAGHRCRELLPRPDGASGARARFEGRIFDLDADGRIEEVGAVASAYGPAPGARRTELLPGDRILLHGPGGRMHLITEGGPRLLHGPAEPELPDWVAAVPAGSSFLLLDARSGLFQWFESSSVEPVPLGVDLGRLIGMAADPSSGDLLVTAADGRFALLPGGDPSAAHLGRLPESFGRPKALASLGRGGFVVVDDRTTAARVAPTGATALLSVEWDDPSTPAVEPEPTAPEPLCREEGPPRANAWLAIAGAEGAAWASGQRGLLVRFTVIGGTRKQLPSFADLAAIRVERRDRVLVGGLGPEPGSEVGRAQRLQLFALDLERGFSDEARERHRGYIETSGVWSLLFGTPRLLLPDETGPLAPTPIVLESGYVPRVGGDDRFAYRRVPFLPRGAAVGPDGRILFFGPEGRLAMGMP